MAQGSKLATFVLVHGAWHGGWCWIKVARLLRDVGHTVYTPTLTGLGDRAHLAHAGVDLGTHVQDIVALLEMEELRNIILVGHSYGGMVISGVAGREAARLAHLVYLDAFVPRKGQAMIDLVAPEAAERMRAGAKDHGEGWRIPPLSPAELGVTSERDTAWIARRLVPQPIRTFEQPLAVDAATRLKRTYVYCSQPARGTFDQFLRFREDRGWRFHEVKTGHDAMVTAAGPITKILLETV